MLFESSHVGRGAMTKHLCQRLFFSSRGMHLVFATRVEAKAAYDDGVERGCTWLILESTQMIDTRAQSKKTEAES